MDPENPADCCIIASRFSEFVSSFPHLSNVLRYDLLIQSLHRARAIWEDSLRYCKPRGAHLEIFGSSQTSRPTPPSGPSSADELNDECCAVLLDSHSSSLYDHEHPDAAALRPAAAAQLVEEAAKPSSRPGPACWPLVDEALMLDLPAAAGQDEGWAPLEQMLPLIFTGKIVGSKCSASW
mmetsp:Transcript_55048/g.145337  ORF Transcript_55048/g.145337 Transcript_55048/m.145337 type:complete len:180 (+) Transcript_55048:474-1013(+)